MARRRRKKRYKQNSSRKKEIREGAKIVREVHDDNIAVNLLDNIFNDSDDVLDATDLNESFKYFKLRQNKKGR